MRQNIADDVQRIETRATVAVQVNHARETFFGPPVVRGLIVAALELVSSAVQYLDLQSVRVTAYSKLIALHSLFVCGKKKKKNSNNVFRILR